MAFGPAGEQGILRWTAGYLFIIPAIQGLMRTDTLQRDFCLEGHQVQCAHGACVCIGHENPPRPAANEPTATVSA